MGSAPDQVSPFSRESFVPQLASLRLLASRSASSHSAVAVSWPRRAIERASSGESRTVAVSRMIGGGMASDRKALQTRQYSVPARSLRFATRPCDPAHGLAVGAFAGKASAIAFHPAIGTTRGFASGHPLHLVSPDRPRRVAGRVPMTRSLQHRQVRPDRLRQCGANVRAVRGTACLATTFPGPATEK